MSTNKKKSKKRGRPKMPKEDSRSRIVLLRVKDDEFKRISRAAKAKDQTLSDWIRGNLGI